MTNYPDNENTEFADMDKDWDDADYHKNEINWKCWGKKKRNEL